jgi:hypothetical protein
VPQEHALRKLHTLVDSNWAEASEFVAGIEALAEDEAFGARQLAAAVASKVRRPPRPDASVAGLRSLRFIHAPQTP